MTPGLRLAAALDSELHARHLERRGLLVRDLESRHLTRGPGEDAALEILQGHAITYRIAMGPHDGRKVFTLQTAPVCAAGLADVVRSPLSNSGQ